MRVLQAGACIDAVILKNRNVVDTVLHAQQGVSFFVHAQNLGHLFIGQQRHAAGVVRAIDDHFVKAETSDTASQPLHAAGR